MRAARFKVYKDGYQGVLHRGDHDHPPKMVDIVLSPEGVKLIRLPARTGTPEELRLYVSEEATSYWVLDGPFEDAVAELDAALAGEPWDSGEESDIHEGDEWDVAKLPRWARAIMGWLEGKNSEEAKGQGKG